MVNQNKGKIKLLLISLGMLVYSCQNDISKHDKNLFIENYFEQLNTDSVLLLDEILSIDTNLFVPNNPIVELILKYNKNITMKDSLFFKEQVKVSVKNENWKNILSDSLSRFTISLPLDGRVSKMNNIGEEMKWDAVPEYFQFSYPIYDLNEDRIFVVRKHHDGMGLLLVDYLVFEWRDNKWVTIEEQPAY